MPVKKDITTLEHSFGANSASIAGYGQLYAHRTTVLEVLRKLAVCNLEHYDDALRASDGSPEAACNRIIGKQHASIRKTLDWRTVEWVAHAPTRIYLAVLYAECEHLHEFAEQKKLPNLKVEMPKHKHFNLKLALHDFRNYYLHPEQIHSHSRRALADGLVHNKDLLIDINNSLDGCIDCSRAVLLREAETSLDSVFDYQRLAFDQVLLHNVASRAKLFGDDRQVVFCRQQCLDIADKRKKLHKTATPDLKAMPITKEQKRAFIYALKHMRMLYPAHTEGNFTTPAKIIQIFNKRHFHFPHSFANKKLEHHLQHFTDVCIFLNYALYYRFLPYEKNAIRSMNTTCSTSSIDQTTILGRLGTQININLSAGLDAVCIALFHPHIKLYQAATKKHRKLQNESLGKILGQHTDFKYIRNDIFHVNKYASQSIVFGHSYVGKIGIAKYLKELWNAYDDEKKKQKTPIAFTLYDGLRQFYREIDCSEYEEWLEQHFEDEKRKIPPDERVRGVCRHGYNAK